MGELTVFSEVQFWCIMPEYVREVKWPPKKARSKSPDPHSSAFASIACGLFHLAQKLLLLFAVWFPQELLPGVTENSHWGTKPFVEADTGKRLADGCHKKWHPSFGVGESGWSPFPRLSMTLTVKNETPFFPLVRAVRRVLTPDCARVCEHGTSSLKGGRFSNRDENFKHTYLFCFFLLSKFQ
jgi:hypothetical protein